MNTYVERYSVEFDAPSVESMAPEQLFSLKGRTALVTGAAGGLGRWFAAGLGAAGANLALSDMSAGGLREVADVLGDRGVTCHQTVVDLRERGAVRQIVGEATNSFGRIDVLVNCAGVNRRTHLVDVDEDTYDFITDVNLRVPFFLAQAVSRVMIANGGGSIINIGSITCGIGVEHSGVYGVTKAGLAQLTKTMAVEWAPYGIRVNCLAPGYFMTPLGVPVWEDDVRSSWMLDRIPFGRPGRASELVGTCILLASDGGRYISGQTIYVDGGCMAGSGWLRTDPAETNAP